MSHARWLALAIPILAGGCRAYSNAPTGTGSLTAAENLAATAPVPAQAERLVHCPSVVSGATTVVQETPGGVELRVTASGDAATEIRRRATYLATAADETRGKHGGSGGVNAQFGRCPVVMRNTKLEVREIPGGAAVVIKPAHAFELDWLRREVQARSAQLAAPKAFGPGLLKTCPSAVPNAETTVTNTASGVDLRIVDTSAGGTREIRERAKALAASGPGQGDRCPSSIPDATLSVSEVPGGILLTMKPKRSEDVAHLRHDVHERARSFEAVRTR